jgi:hypothetical protein
LSQGASRYRLRHFFQQLQKIDELHDEDKGKECYDRLQEMYQKDEKDVEILWRLARACCPIANIGSITKHWGM